LPQGWALHRFLKAPRQARRWIDPEPLAIDQILSWADAHHAATGQWPRPSSGPVPGAPFLIRWAAIDRALLLGLRGLPGNSSLAGLLFERRAAANPKANEGRSARVS
jgi:hypothetical protein